MQLYAEQCQRLDETILVHVEAVKNTSSAVAASGDFCYNYTVNLNGLRFKFCVAKLGVLR